jgi:hypothetical protein
MGEDHEGHLFGLFKVKIILMRQQDRARRLGCGFYNAIETFTLRLTGNGELV